MDRNNGLSDFRFLAGQPLTHWLEHGGVALSVANFTVLPGAFSWHAKGLFLKGEILPEAFLTGFAIDILLVTWFFSSLYLLTLYFVLFLKPLRANSSFAMASSGS